MERWSSNIFSRQFITRYALVLLSLLLLFGTSQAAFSNQASNHADQKPVLKDGTSKWRIGYIETSKFANYAGTLYGIVKGLESSGWIKTTKGLPFTQGSNDSQAIWKWLSQNATSDYIEFNQDAFYSISGDQAKKDAIKARLAKQDLDLLIVMGTSAGKLVKNEKHSIPTLVFSSSNAKASGIVNEIEKSGISNVWAHMDPNRYKLQLRVFYDVFKFKKVGIVYEDSELGRIYSAIDDVKAVSKEKGFDVVEEHVIEPVDFAKDYEPYIQSLIQANTRLTKKVDAMYLPLGLWDSPDLPRIIKPFLDAKIPLFSQLGVEEVKMGVLISLARPDFTGIGTFGATKISDVFHAKLPGDLSQVYGDTPSIAINLAAAKKIGYKAPFDILISSDEIYTELVPVSGN